MGWKDDGSSGVFSADLLTVEPFGWPEVTSASPMVRSGLWRLFQVGHQKHRLEQGRLRGAACCSNQKRDGRLEKVGYQAHPLRHLYLINIEGNLVPVPGRFLHMVSGVWPEAGIMLGPRETGKAAFDG